MNPQELQEALDVLLVSDPPNIVEWNKAIQVLNKAINQPVINEAEIRKNQRERDAHLFMHLWKNGEPAATIVKRILHGEVNE